MEIRYKRELNRTWIVLPAGTGVDTYISRILSEDLPEHLLAMQPVPAGTEELRFDVTNGHSMAVLLEKRPLTFPEIRQLFTALSEVLREMEERLLGEDHLLLDPSFIYGMPDLGCVKFCCHPGYQEDFFEQLEELLRYCLDKIDHQDRKSVEVAYEMFRISGSGYYRFDDLMEVIGRSVFENPAGEKEADEPEGMQEDTGRAAAKTMKKNGRREEKREDRNRKKPCLKKRKKKREEKKDPWHAEKTGAGYWISGAVAAAAAALILTGAGIYLHHLTGQWDWRFFAGAAAVGLAGVVSVIESFLILRRYRDYERDELPDGGTVVLSEVEDGPPGVRRLVPFSELEAPEILLRKTPFVIGKNLGDADAGLGVDTVSRVHAELESRGEGWCIRDCHSTNGTWVNGIRLTPDAWYPLQEGDEIRFADIRFRFA